MHVAVICPSTTYESNMGAFSEGDGATLVGVSIVTFGLHTEPGRQAMEVLQQKVDQDNDAVKTDFYDVSKALHHDR